MTMPLEREGIFKARPVSWEVSQADSGAVAVSFCFEIVAQLDQGNEEHPWIDWSSSAPHHCYGAWWVVGKDRKIHQGAVDQLKLSLGWNGSLLDVSATEVPDKIVQITVKAETYKEKTRYKAGWMRPEDYVPTGGGASVSEVQQLDAQFGSLLRAAAAAVKAKAAGDGATEQSAEASAHAPPPPEEGPPPLDDSDIPF